jgi:hypothetical protein
MPAHPAPSARQWEKALPHLEIVRAAAAQARKALGGGADTTALSDIEGTVEDLLSDAAFEIKLAREEEERRTSEDHLEHVAESRRLGRPTGGSYWDDV